MRPIRKLLLLGQCVSALLLGTTVCSAQVGTEAQLKAAYLVNFLKYVEWPGTRTSSTICLFGRDVIGNALSVYEGRIIGGHELFLRRINGPDLIDDCQLLFIPDSEEARFTAIMRWTEGKPILTVSDTELFVRQGGAISLVRNDTRLQFDVNVAALNRVGLKPASQMMRLARQVTGGAR